MVTAHAKHRGENLPQLTVHIASTTSKEKQGEEEANRSKRTFSSSGKKTKIWSIGSSTWRPTATRWMMHHVTRRQGPAKTTTALAIAVAVAAVAALLAAAAAAAAVR